MRTPRIVIHNHFATRDVFGEHPELEYLLGVARRADRKKPDVKHALEDLEDARRFWTAGNTKGVEQEIKRAKSALQRAGVL